MKWAITTFLQLILFVLPAQTSEVFTVKAKQSIKLLPDVDTLVAGKSYTFQFTGIAPESVQYITSGGGIVTRKKNVLTLKVKATTALGTQFVLQFFTDKSNLLQPYWQKKFAIMPGDEAPQFSPPPPTVGRTPVTIYCWSRGLNAKDTVAMRGLFNGLYVGAYRLSSMGVSYTVTSFKVTMKCGSTEKTYYTRGYNLSNEMLDALKEVQAGCTITLKEIHYISANSSPDDLIAGPYEVYIKP